MSRSQKLCQRLDDLEVRFRQELIRELRRFAEGPVQGDDFYGSYLFRGPFPEAAGQLKTPESEAMLQMDREIRALRRKLGVQGPGPAVGLADEFARALRQDLEANHHAHGNSWARAARLVLRDVGT